MGCHVSFTFHPYVRYFLPQEYEFDCECSLCARSSLAGIARDALLTGEGPWGCTEFDLLVSNAVSPFELVPLLKQAREQLEFYHCRRLMVEDKMMMCAFDSLMLNIAWSVCADLVRGTDVVNSGSFQTR